ncbi:transcription initiation factor TFIID subunit 9B [Cryptococcus deuterogattii 99/473]|uniref:Transcription initiation factor TFIID subunit 9B n=2 Tax=Cryptococcus deuterogattii TaxID=1859096 RepID=A0A0D0TC97_9TREE|nr:transcription initiation factor TFIID subunit 9B [Cryptococcus deuterogattii R265]KIR30149.1 transcription initiation factor TFIID subunit 9B [Cryptococcus deuterogattii LA55]KIR37263.1 transcription initiation factor TFIID subunit 9B [Cryptococcus deuterogattii MMRL2647]KIR43732.1 transcription initiation factor TFIID subunit 9B [Cryptococcus deuterogattii Ram5]KIR75064.1 transcription initiation factor TFIID subunit 9B [Cryptococcus deuterogattii CA1014]KIR92733.1 transcription initiation
MSHTVPTIPRDGRLISLILASKGIEDADERVIHQLLDFSRRYTADVLQSAQTLADHAARTGASSNRIEKEDVELAIKMRKLYEFFEAPPRDYLATLAHELNSHPLPALPETFDLVRLPPAHQRLAEVNFDIVPDAELVLTEDEREDEGDSEEDEHDDGDEDRKPDGEAGGDVDGDGEDEDMEEVGVDGLPSAGTAPEAAPVRQAVDVDEDYDM